MEMEHNRRFPRIEIDEPVGVLAGDNYKVEKGRQFSEGGMLFDTLRDFTTGQLITLTFQLSDTVLIRIEAQVAYIFKPAPGRKVVGVRFLDAPNDHVKVLLEYFQKRGSA